MEVRSVNVVVRPDGRVDAQNAAAYIGLAPKTLAMMRCKGTGPKFIKRGRIFYFLAELDSWLKAGEVTSTSQSRTRK